MPDILMTRIDNRLVHGQVGVAWTTALPGVNLIVVADDLAAADPLQQSLMTATAKSSGCGIRFTAAWSAVDRRRCPFRRDRSYLDAAHRPECTSRAADHHVGGYHQSAGHPPEIWCDAQC